LKFAARQTRPGRPALLLLHGVTGCGKTTLSQQILQTLGAVRLRSDVERKRLFGLGPLEDSSRIPGGIYTEAASRRTFERIEALSRRLLSAGFRVVCDATFLRRQHREPLIRAAQALGVPWFILSLKTDVSLLRERVARRAQARTDASEATLEVLDKQLQELEPFAPDEAAHVIVFDGNDASTWPAAIAALARRVGVSV
ncbi:MAG: AAA family ATPase, partial [Thiobacillaceae bacterium]